MELLPNHLIATSGILKFSEGTEILRVPAIAAYMAMDEKAPNTVQPLILKAFFTERGLYTLLRPAWEQRLRVLPRDTLFEPHMSAISNELHAGLVHILSDRTLFSRKAQFHPAATLPAFPWSKLPEETQDPKLFWNIAQQDGEDMLIFKHIKNAPPQVYGGAQCTQLINVDVQNVTIKPPRTVTYLDI